MTNLHYIFFVFILGVAVSLCVGCSGNTQVTGHVTFDDGTPLTVGDVIFESATMQARGVLDQSGRYVLGSTRASDGVPPGQYRVYISGAMEPTGRMIGDDRTPRPEMRSLIDTKHASPETSELTCDVRGSTVFNITVSRPAN